MNPSGLSPIAIDDFDRALVADAAAELMPCCSSRRWVSQLVRGRPYGRLDRLNARSDAILASLSGTELAEALADQAEHGVEAGSSADRSAYEQRFGHVFLLSATGLSIEALHSTLRSRLRNDPVAEREIARTELRKIVRQRLATAFC